MRSMRNVVGQDRSTLRGNGLRAAKTKASPRTRSRGPKRLAHKATYRVGIWRPEEERSDIRIRNIAADGITIILPEPSIGTEYPQDNNDPVAPFLTNKEIEKSPPLPIDPRDTARPDDDFFGIPLTVFLTHVHMTGKSRLGKTFSMRPYTSGTLKARMDSLSAQ